MKIEMGESLIFSWLKHSKNCQLVQSNWKPSMQAWEYYNEILVENIIDDMQEFFLNSHEYDLFKKNKSISQIIQQGEIDVLGIEMAKSSLKDIYAVDIAFHENGLNYGSKKETVERVLKKLVRMACTILYFFDLKDAKIIFAAPKINKSDYEELKSALLLMSDHMNNTWELDFEFKLICNDDFKNKIYDVVVTLSKNISDTSELFMRSVQMYNSLNNKKNRFQIEIQNDKSVLKSVKPSDENSNFILEHPNSSYNEIKIGALVRTTFPELVNENLINETDINKLAMYDYCKSQFDINYPFLKKVDESISIKENRMVNNYPRYYSNPIKILGSKYLITSEWYERNKSFYIYWLDRKRGNI